MQTRETVFAWNPEAKRIEFTDYIDQGGHGLGYVEARDAQLYMDVKIVGNDQHPAWRAWIKETGDEQVLEVEAQRDGQWGKFGTFPYKRVR